MNFYKKELNNKKVITVSDKIQGDDQTFKITLSKYVIDNVKHDQGTQQYSHLYKQNKKYFDLLFKENDIESVGYSEENNSSNVELLFDKLKEKSLDINNKYNALDEASQDFYTYKISPPQDVVLVFTVDGYNNFVKQNNANDELLEKTLIIDEAHLVTKKQFNALSGKEKILMTATPELGEVTSKIDKDDTYEISRNDIAKDTGHTNVQYGSVNINHGDDLVVAKMLKDVYKPRIILPGLSIGEGNEKAELLSIENFISKAIISNSNLPFISVANLPSHIAEKLAYYANNPKEASELVVSDKSGRNLEQYVLQEKKKRLSELKEMLAGERPVDIYTIPVNLRKQYTEQRGDLYYLTKAYKIDFLGGNVPTSKNNIEKQDFLGDNVPKSKNFSIKKLKEAQANTMLYQLCYYIAERENKVDKLNEHLKYPVINGYELNEIPDFITQDLNKHKDNLILDMNSALSLIFEDNELKSKKLEFNYIVSNIGKDIDKFIDNIDKFVRNIPSVINYNDGYPITDKQAIINASKMFGGSSILTPEFDTGYDNKFSSTAFADQNVQSLGRGVRGMSLSGIKTIVTVGKKKFLHNPLIHALDSLYPQKINKSNLYQKGVNVVDFYQKNNNLQYQIFCYYHEQSKYFKNIFDNDTRMQDILTKQFPKTKEDRKLYREYDEDKYINKYKELYILRKKDFLTKMFDSYENKKDLKQNTHINYFNILKVVQELSELDINIDLNNQNHIKNIIENNDLIIDCISNNKSILTNMLSAQTRIEMENYTAKKRTYVRLHETENEHTPNII